MKQTILKSVMAVLVALFSFNAHAYDAYIDGIYYNLVPKTKKAEVTYKEKVDLTHSYSYSGKVVIPESITIGDVTYTVTSIGDAAFRNCSVTSISIPNSIVYIGEYAFRGCEFISVDIPKNVTTIARGAFQWCTKLKSVNIPDNVTNIGEYAFSQCQNMTSVSIPNGVTSIGSCAFYNCQKLKSVIIPNTVTSIGFEAFQGCSSLTYVTIPESVASIGSEAFEGCSSLISVTILQGLSSISYKAFQNCSSLTLVSIPNSVTSIVGSSFENCKNLEDVYCYANSVPSTTNQNGIYNDAFKDSYIEYATLHVPEESIDAYKSQEPWSGFGKIVAIKPFHTLVYVVDGETYKSIVIEEGETIKAEAEPVKEGYTFSGWSEIPATMPANDVTVTGLFTPNKYNLIYKVDEETYKTTQVEFGKIITPETKPIKEGYTFSGWSEIPTTMPAKDVTITGSFTINKYNLIYNVDGEEYKSVQINYGATITSETEPVKEGYSFSGWSEIPKTMPAKDVIVTGSFTPNKYNLIYKVDGETYKSYQVEYGKSIIAETEPTKDKFSFSGWSEIPATMPAHDVTITGSFTRMPLVASYKRNLSSQTTGVSSMIIGSYVRKSVGFNLVNLGEESINVTELVVKNASNYAVVSRSTDASLLGTLAAGNSIELSVNLTSDITTCYEWHYTYKGQEFVFCSDVNDPAMKHDVTFYVDGQVYVTYEYDLGDEIIPEEEPTKEHYTFSGWSEIPATMPDKNVAVNGTFIGDKYTLTYIVDEETYKTYEVEYGTAITAEAAPTKEGYSFSGWDEIPATMPANDVMVTGSFAINSYKLTYTVDGEEYKTSEVEYGTILTAETEPFKEGYTFSGWSKVPATMPAKDVTITGTFSKGQFQITYVVDGVTYKTIRMDFGGIITAVEAPEKEGYAFSGWSEIPATMPANDITVTGSFTINKYTLTYIVDGETYVTYEMNYGTQIFPLQDLTKDGYTFSGWSTIPETMPAEDVTITGTFNVNSYKLTYMVDGDEYKTVDVEYGAGITPEEEPIKEGYTFSGWDLILETMPAHDVTITGTFTFVDAIEGVLADDGEYQIYTLDGKPVETLQKGVNIIKYMNGKVKKMYVK